MISGSRLVLHVPSRGVEGLVRLVGRILARLASASWPRGEPTAAVAVPGSGCSTGSVGSLTHQEPSFDCPGGSGTVYPAPRGLPMTGVDLYRRSQPSSESTATSPAKSRLCLARYGMRLFATVLSLTPMARAMARSLRPSSRRCAAFSRMSRYAGVEPVSTTDTLTGIAAAVRILCVRVHLSQRIRTALRSGGGRFG